MHTKEIIRHSKDLIIKDPDLQRSITVINHKRVRRLYQEIRHASKYIYEPGKS